MAIYGYARVSTADQQLDLQIEALKNAGCQTIFEEKVSGTIRYRPELNRLLDIAKRGDTVIIWKLDRLGRSAQHLLEVADRLTYEGVHLRCLTAPIDTSSSAGTLMLQMLAAFAEFERNLNSERTKAGLANAASKGRVGGNPALRRRDEKALQKSRQIQEQIYFDEINRTAFQWVPVVQRMRPERSWDDVVKALNASLGKNESKWTRERLRRAAGRFVREGLMPAVVLGRSDAKPKDDRLLAIVAGIKSANPKATLGQIAAHLDKTRESPPRGGRKWQVSSVKLLLEQAQKKGFLQ